MNKLIINLLVGLWLGIYACDEGGQRSSDRGNTEGYADAVKTEAEIKRPRPLFSVVETYNEAGELTGSTEYFYGFIPLNPSYEEKDASGAIVTKVNIANDDNGFILQRKTEKVTGNSSAIKIEDFERDAEGNVTAVTVDNDGQYRRTEIILSEHGKEVRSQVFNASDQLLSEREVNWEKNEITFYAYDEDGKPTLEWNYHYLMLEMVEGQLRPLFNYSQKKDVLTDVADSTWVEGKCETSISPVKCEQTFYGKSGVVLEKRNSSFYIVPIDNNFYRYHELMEIEVASSEFVADKLKSEKTTTLRYGDAFQLKSTSVSERIIGGAIGESETLYFYDAEGRILSEESRLNGNFAYKKIYGY